MQSAVLIQQTVPAFVSDLSIDGELTISQKAPLQCHRMGIDTHLNQSVVEEENDVEKYKIGNILQNYFTRDCKYTIYKAIWMEEIYLHF